MIRHLEKKQQLTSWCSAWPYVEICSALVRLKGCLLPQPATAFLTFYSQQRFLPSGVRDAGQVSVQSHCPRGQALYTALDQVSLYLCACLACCQNPRLKQTAEILPQDLRGRSADPSHVSHSEEVTSFHVSYSEAVTPHMCHILRQ